MVNELFTDWLKSEMKARDVSQADLARMTGISTAHVSLIYNGMRNPGNEFLQGVARAFNLPVELVMRKAGVLPAGPEHDPILDELIHIYDNLPETERELFLAMARTMLAQIRPSQRNQNKPTTSPAPAD